MTPTALLPETQISSSVTIWPRHYNPCHIKIQLEMESLVKSLFLSEIAYNFISWFDVRAGLRWHLFVDKLHDESSCWDLLLWGKIQACSWREGQQQGERNYLLWLSSVVNSAGFPEMSFSLSLSLTQRPSGGVSNQWGSFKIWIICTGGRRDLRDH